MINKSKVIALPIAIMSKNEMRSISFNSLLSGSAKHQFQEGKTAMQVMAMSLSGVQETFKLLPPDYVKIDVDGVEREIIENANFDNVKGVLVEVNSDESEGSVHNVLSKKFDRVAVDDLSSWGFEGKYPKNEIWTRKKYA
jgi:hypothetical protein